LTREYLQGKRKEYVAPVKLYIVVSFVVFFVGGAINTFTDKSESDSTNFNFNTRNQTGQRQNISNDSLELALSSFEEEWTFSTTERTLREYDWIQDSLPENLEDKGLGRLLRRKEVELKQKYTFREFKSKISEMAQKSIPKFLFLCMPFFAFLM